MPYQWRGKYFEEFNIGQQYFLPSRTVTEADVVNFAAFSGDYNPLHTDEQFARSGLFGARIAHGLVSLAIITGLMDKAGFIEGTVQAFLGCEWKFKKPVLFGDTITGVFTVAETRETKRPDRGIVKFNVAVINHKGEEVSGGTLDMMIARKK